MRRGPVAPAAGARRTAGQVAALPLEWLILLYQRLISPMLPASCRFYPSCSAYGLTAVRRFGPVTGTWLTARRLGRCHPFTDGGVDHVPPRWGDEPDGPTQTRWTHRPRGAPGSTATDRPQGAAPAAYRPGTASHHRHT